jgi:hypothetical protein
MVVNPATRLIDLSLAGVVVPADCASQTVMPRAQCDFDHYLQSLDGFPTAGAATAPASEDLDPTTLAGNVVVVDRTRGAAVAPLAVAWDAATKQVSVAPQAGWDVGTDYVIAVRGYANGVRTATGRRVTGAPLTWLLKQPDSLTCGAATPEAISDDCEYFGLLCMQADRETARTALLQLEGARAYLAVTGAWEAATGPGGMARDDIAVLWSFPTHSAPVVELDPAAGKVPVATAPREIRMGFRGALQASTLTPFSLEATDGTVLLADLTALTAAEIDLAAVLPAFTVGLEGSEVVLETAADLADGHDYVVLMTRKVTGPSGVPLAAPPLTALLKARGPLSDAKTGKSNVDALADADAAQLEPVRAQFAALLDDAAFGALTGLTRDDIAFLFGLHYAGGKAP